MLNNLGLGINIKVKENATKAFGKMKKGFNKFNSVLPKGIQNIGSMIGKMGGWGIAIAGVTALIAGLVIGIGAAVETSRKWETGMSVITTLFDNQMDPAIKKIEKDMLTMSVQTGATFEDLQDGGTSVDAFIFTNKSKEKIIDKLIVAIEMRLITFPNIQVVIDELRAFESIALPSGKIRYQAPPGMTDDCVIGLALAVDQIDIYQSKRELPQPIPFWSKVKEDLVHEKIDKLNRMDDETAAGVYKEVGDDGFQNVW